jgi:hypothetical protein
MRVVKPSGTVGMVLPSEGSVADRAMSADADDEGRAAYVEHEAGNFAGEWLRAVAGDLAAVGRPG